METTWIDACAQAELVREGAVAPLELVEAAIERIERVDGRLNAVIHERFEQARAEAAGPLPEGPFRGVPLLLKDLNCQSSGDPSHNGARVLKEAGWRADHDSAFVARLRRAGFVIVGRTNTPELGASLSTEPRAYGPTHNPWDPERSPGGSSGGSAAAVAAGMVALAHGNDAGGSLRIPASCCGIVGLKPTRARVSQAPDVGAAWGIGTTIDGMLSRTVRDTAAALDCMAGGEPGDPFPAPSLPRPLAEELDAAPGSLRIGVLAAPPRADVAADADATAAVERAARLLEAAGHGVELAHPAALGDEQFLVRLFELMAVDAAAQVADWSRRLGRPIAVDELELGNAAFLVAAREITAARYAETLAWMHAFQRRVAAWWAQDGFDLLLSPVLNGPPAPLGMLVDPLHGRERALQLWQYTPQFNVTGQPAISLPLHWTADDLPIGVQLVASYGREDLLVRVAAQLERSAQWSERRPAVRA